MCDVTRGEPTHFKHDDDSDDNDDDEAEDENENDDDDDADLQNVRDIRDISVSTKLADWGKKCGKTSSFDK